MERVVRWWLVGVGGGVVEDGEEGGEEGTGDGVMGLGSGWEWRW